MARRRWIDPSFWDDRKLGRLKPIERLFFIGCFSNADDEGRLLGDPAYLRATIFKYDDMDLDTVREARDNTVSTMKNLVLYENDEEEYLAFRNWSDYQKPNYPKESKLPAPPFMNDNRSRTEVVPKSKQRQDDDMGRVGLGRVGQDRVGSDEEHTFSSIWLQAHKTLNINSRLAEEMDAYMGEVTPELFEAAVLEAIRLGKRENWKYTKAIIDNCAREGRMPGDATHKRHKGLAAELAEYDRVAAERAAKSD